MTTIMKKLYGMMFILLLIILPACTTAGDPITEDAIKLIAYHESKYDDVPASGKIVDGVREIHIKAYQYYFEPSLVVVNKGERIRLIVESMDVPHGFELHGIDLGGWDLDAKIRKGMPAVIEFEATDEGVYEYICSIYCGFGHSQMRGLFVVR